MVAFCFDLCRQTLTLSLRLLTAADIVDDDLCGRLPLPLEAHSADFYRHVSPVLASELGLDLCRPATVCHQYSHTIAATIQIFRRNEFEDVPSSDVLHRSVKDPHHSRVGQMNRPVGSGHNDAIRR